MKIFRAAGFKTVLIALAVLALMPVPGRSEVIKVMAANLISGGWPYIYYFNPSRIFQGLEPDIVLIQEFKVKSPATRESYVDDVFGPEFYLYYEAGGSPNGIISRWPFKSSGEWSDPEVPDRDFAWAVIDIPGDIDLQVVSVHLKAASGPTERATREREAIDIKAYVQANFNDNHYILVGGDLNTYHSPTEPCLNVFASFLDYNDHLPVDRNGNSDTNENRNQHYDWLMPNQVLDAHHTTLNVGTNSQSYPEGIVFDSWIFTPLGEVSPIESDDSHGTMTHMAVIKAYNINAPPCVEEGFDGFDTGTRPDGWTFTNCDLNTDTYTAPGNYGAASPSIKLDATGDRIETAVFSQGEWLRFWLKGQGTDASSHLLVEEYYGSAWNEITDLYSLPATGTTIGDLALRESSNRLRFSYTRSSGEAAFDDLVIRCLITPTPTAAPTATPTPRVITPTPTPEICTRLDEGFDGFDTGTRPGGWTFTNCNLNTDTYTTAGNYGAAPPSIKLDATGDRIETAVFSQGEWLQFWLKGQGTDASSHLLVEEYYGTGWSEITDLYSLPATGTMIGDLALLESASRLRFSYTGVLGATAFDDLLVGCLTTPTPTAATPATPTPTPPPVPTSTPPPSPAPTSTAIPGPTSTPIPGPDPTISPASQALPWIYDYNGDGTSDIAIFRGSAGLWAIRGVTRVYFGSSADETVPGDYNGDRTTEIGIFRSATGLWAVRGVTRSYFGIGSDSPEPGDYNGDGTWDIGLFRSSSGLWAIQGVTRIYFGSSADTPVPGYYAGSTSKNIGIFRGASGLWAIRGVTRSYFGSASDTVVPGDYDGDGSWDIGIFRPTSGLWAIRGVTRSYFGSGSDHPVPADYKGDGRDDIGIFRDTSGLWAIRSISRIYFGASGDVPVTR